MIEARAVLWLRWRQHAAIIRYWLAAVGYDTRDVSLMNRLYSVYIAIFFAGWLVVMWAFTASQAIVILLQLPFSPREALLEGLPPLVYGLLALSTLGALRSSPLKLSFPDLAYIAGAPMPRASAVLAAFFDSTAKLLLAAGVIAIAVSSILAQPLGATGLLAAVVQTTVATVLLVAFAITLAWLIGILPVALERARPLRSRWYLAGLLFIAGLFAPEIAFWPGAVFARAVLGLAQASDMIFLAILTLPILIGLADLARKVNLIDVSDESVAFARIGALGVATSTVPDLTQRILHQRALAARKPFWRLIDARGDGALFARAALSAVRGPGLILQGVGGGLILSQLGSQILLDRTTLSTFWLPWLVALLIIPPRSLVESFRAEQDNQFVRQLLPANVLMLLATSTALPLALVGIISFGFSLFAQGDLARAIVGSLITLLIALLFALTQAVGIARARFLGIRLSYLRAATITFGPLLILAALDNSPATLIPAAATLAVLLGQILAEARR